MLRTQGGRGKGATRLTETVCTVWSDAAPGEDAAGGIRAVCSKKREEARQEAPDLRFPWIDAYLRPQPEREVHSAREDDGQTAPQRVEGDRRVVSKAPPRPGERATENPERQAPRSLPILWPADELPQHLAVLSAGPMYLARVAESPHTRAEADVGAVRCSSTAVPAFATSDYARLGERGESRLRNPLR